MKVQSCTFVYSYTPKIENVKIKTMLNQTPFSCLIVIFFTFTFNYESINKHYS